MLEAPASLLRAQRLAWSSKLRLSSPIIKALGNSGSKGLLREIAYAVGNKVGLGAVGIA
jgi:hypothetical protein